MKTRPWQPATSVLCIGLLALSALPPPAFAQEEEHPGYIIGRVFEVDQAKYRDYLAKQQSEQAGTTETKIDPEQFLDPRSGVTVTARQIENNSQFDSNLTRDAGDYLIVDTPPGVYEFTLHYEGQDYPVSQRLGMKVDLSFIAELCFVIDKQAKVAWMVAEGARRAPEVPPFVPEECQSPLGACLAMVVGADTIPGGLILLLAGSAAAATNIGIIAAEQDEASTPIRKQ